MVQLKQTALTGRQLLCTVLTDRTDCNAIAFASVLGQFILASSSIRLTHATLLKAVERALQPHQERLCPTTLTLSMFMAQTLNADAYCQATVYCHVVERIAHELTPCSTVTGAYCNARQRLLLAMMQPLLRETGALLTKEGAAA